jgi:ribosome-associated translation inhibitor RaiA
LESQTQGLSQFLVKQFLILKQLSMTIQFNTDNNIQGNEELTAPLTSLISDKLNRFRDKISRVEVHLSNENGNKEGQNDKRCLLEARMEGKQPIAVTNTANSHEQAVEGAIDKLKTSLDTIIGRERNY